jgi:serine protease Do
LPEIPSLPSISVPHFQMSWQDGMLGIEGESLGQQRQLADFFGVKDGVLVKSVMRNSTAEKAGDVIVKVDGISVGNTREITGQLRSARSKKSVAVVVVRDRKENSLTVNLDALDRNGNPPAPPGEKF